MTVLTIRVGSPEYLDSDIIKINRTDAIYWWYNTSVYMVISPKSVFYSSLHSKYV